MPYVLSNDQFEPRMFLAGTADLPIGEGLVVSAIIFNAQPFDTETEARETADQIPGRWAISEVADGGSAS